MLLELTVAEQRFNAVMEVLRDGLTVTEVAGRYGVSRQPSTAGCAATAPAGWTPWPTALIGPGVVHIRCRPPSRPACASCAGVLQAGANAVSLMSWPAPVWIHRPG